MPLTDKGFLLHEHLGTVMGNGYDNATMPRFTYGYGANGQAAYVRDSELNRTVWTEYDTSERPMRVHVLEGGDEDDFHAQRRDEVGGRALLPVFRRR